MIKAVRGTRDLLPPDTALWNRVEKTVREVFRAYNFQEIRTPIFESTELFARGVGEETDIVAKEMFTWSDGERFNERKLVDAWLETNRADNPAHVQAGRVTKYTVGAWLSDLNNLGVIHVIRGMQGAPPTNLPVSREEFVAFAPNVSPEAIDNLVAARNIAKERYANEFARHAIDLRLVVPADNSNSSPWVDRKDVEIEGFPGTFFSSSQSLTLRPENTAGVVRAYIEHKLWDRGLNKLYYIGPQFRRERPQKGRYRQFYQIGAEVIGPPSSGSRRPIRDAEVLEMLDTLLKAVGIKDSHLEINSVGDPSDRVAFNEAIRGALAPVVAGMCVDCQRRAVTNPLRVFDCKVPEDQPIIDRLPRITQYLSAEAEEHFENVKAILRATGIQFHVNDRLVRGLDYYTRTAFEFTHGALGAQNAILGGGRYDGLAESLGAKESSPGIGFAIGEDRVILALQQQGSAVPFAPDAYVAPVREGMNRPALQLAKELRAHGLVIELGDRSFKLGKLLEIAAKLGSHYAVIVGENEVATNEFTVKDLTTGDQAQLPRAELARRIKERNATQSLPGRKIVLLDEDKT